MFLYIQSHITDEDMLHGLNVVYSRVIREEKNMTTTRSKEQRSDILGFSVKTNTLNETPPTIVNPFHQGQEILLVHAHTMVEKVMTLHNTFYFMGTQNAITSNKVKTIIINEVDVEEGLVETGAMDVGANSAHATQNNSDQISSLISLLQNQPSNLSSERLSGKTTHTDVIIDTCVSHHMTGDFTILKDVYDNVSSVTFPNSITQATK